MLSIEGEDARRLERISAARGEKPTDVIAELLREADKPAAELATFAHLSRLHARDGCLLRTMKGSPGAASRGGIAE